jgi:hypothetical protein
MTKMPRQFCLPLILLLLLPLSGWGEWILNPDQSSEYPYAVITPDERVIVFYNVLASAEGITPWVLSYELIDGVPEVIYNHFYSDSINATGAPVQVRGVSDRCYVLTIHTYPERHWEMYAIDFNGETLWHNVMTSESDPDYSEVMQDHMMAASEAGVIIVWDDYSGESAWTGRWYAPDGNEVREIGPYPNPEYSNRFALASREDGFLLCHLNSATIIGQEQDSIATVDIGHWMYGSHQVGNGLYIFEQDSGEEEYALIRHFSLEQLITTWVDTIYSGPDIPFCTSTHWTDHSLVFNQQDDCNYLRFDSDSLYMPPSLFFISNRNNQVVTHFPLDDIDWIMQKDSLEGHDCEIFFGYPDSVVWRYQAGIHTNRPLFLLSDSERLHLIWQDGGSIHLKLLPDELETVFIPQIPASSELQVYPNPFNNSCQLQLQLQRAGVVRLKVHDILGREVAVWNEQLPAGLQRIYWQPERLSGGIYFITATPEGSTPQKVRALYLP